MPPRTFKTVGNVSDHWNTTFVDRIDTWSTWRGLLEATRAEQKTRWRNEEEDDDDLLIRRSLM
jgi:hypothetical protein